MNIKEIINGYLGNTQVNSIYQGSELVWPIKYVGNRYLIGGVFTTFNGSTQNRLIRLNMNGSLDTSFNIGTGFSDTVLTINMDTINQKIYVGGNFSTYNGSTQNRIVRLNYNGSKDTSFNIGTGFNNSVYAINIDTINQKIYVGGGFTTYNGTTQNRLVRLNMDGSLDTNFNIGTGFNNSVYAINIDTINQKIYVGGSFRTFNGSTQNRLIRLNMNGSLDNTFNIGTGFNNAIRGMIIDTINQKIYVVGWFTTYNGNVQNRICRLNMNGTIDNTFNVGGVLNGGIMAINVDTINQKIYVGGDFTTYNGNVQNRICRLNMNGSLDNTFNVGTGFNSYINSILVDNEKNKIYIAGTFTKYNDQQQKYLARLNMDGSLDNTFNIQLDNVAMTILKYTE